MGGGRYFGLGECYFWGCNFMCVRFYFVCGGVPYMGCVLCPLGRVPSCFVKCVVAHVGGGRLSLIVDA